MHRENTDFTALPLQLGCHVSQHLIEGSLRGSICPETVLELAKVCRGPTIAGDEDDVLNGDCWSTSKQLLCNDNWPDCVGGKVQGEVEER